MAVRWTGLAMTLIVAGCGYDVIARLVGQDNPANKPIDVANWYEAAKSELPMDTGPFGPTALLDVEDHDGVRVAMSVESPDDVLIYSIGEVVPGERIAIQAIPIASSRLDPVVAVFDADMNWINYNDDRHYYERQIDSMLDFKVRTYSEECFVAIAASPRAESVGDMDLYVSRAIEALPKPSTPQIIYLEFGGRNNVVIGRSAPVNVPTFHASAFDPQMEFATQTMIEGVSTRVQQDLAWFNVTVLSSHWHDRPLTAHTTIYFGSENPGLLGLSDNIDTFNQYDGQDAIIFVESFDLFTVASPTTQQWIDVLANVASHEIGHLLGLHHTADPTEIMDTSANLLEMLEAQSFHRAPLHEGTFAVGYQDSVATLFQNVGPSESFQAKIDDELYPPDEAPVPLEPTKSGIPARSYCKFGTACLSATLKNRLANVQN